MAERCLTPDQIETILLRLSDTTDTATIHFIHGGPLSTRARVVVYNHSVPEEQLTGAGETPEGDLILFLGPQEGLVGTDGKLNRELAAGLVGHFSNMLRANGVSVVEYLAGQPVNGCRRQAPAQIPQVTTTQTRIA